jgi:CheY-like chemotaxis protein
MKKILLVEDDAFLNQLYNDLLKGAGYEVDVATDGDQAYEKMHQGGYDLVLLDMMMPGMSGLQVMEKLQTSRAEKPNAKVIFLTNTDNPDDIKKIHEISDGYLLKSSMDPDEFVKKIQSYL